MQFNIASTLYFISRVNVGNGNLRTEPKFVVSFYHNCCCCLMSAPSVKFPTLWWMLSNWYHVQVSTTCCNKKCLKWENTWKSQPHTTGTLIPAGNFLLSFAILVAGGFTSKLLRIFRYMGMACMSLTTCFDHQWVIINGKYKMLYYV